MSGDRGGQPIDDGVATHVHWRFLVVAMDGRSILVRGSGSGGSEQRRSPRPGSSCCDGPARGSLTSVGCVFGDDARLQSGAQSCQPGPLACHAIFTDDALRRCSRVPLQASRTRSFEQRRSRVPSRATSMAIIPQPRSRKPGSPSDVRAPATASPMRAFSAPHVAKA